MQVGDGGWECICGYRKPMAKPVPNQAYLLLENERLQKEIRKFEAREKAIILALVNIPNFIKRINDYTKRFGI